MNCGRKVTKRRELEAALKQANETLEQRVAERTADLERMNRNLHESEVRFRMAVNHLPDAFVIYDAQRRIQFVNAAGLTLTERLIEEFLGRTDEEIHPPTVTDAYLHCSSGQSKRKAIKQENARLLYQTVRPIRS